MVYQYGYPDHMIHGVFSSAERALEAAVGHCLKDTRYVCQLFYPRVGLMDKDWVKEYTILRYTFYNTDKHVSAHTRINAVLKEYLSQHDYDQFKRQVSRWPHDVDPQFLGAFR